MVRHLTSRRFVLPVRVAVAALACALFASPASAYEQKPPGGSYKDCHGYVLHVSAGNIRVHCTDGTPADLSFVTLTSDVQRKDGTTTPVADLKDGTPVHVQFSQSLGVRHAYKIYLADPQATGLYGFKS
jgi:hypothetical protein